ncbi:MAG: hypothetical protein WA892_14230 [Ornithinimicrobium sp.]
MTRQRVQRASATALVLFVFAFVSSAASSATALASTTVAQSAIGALETADPHHAERALTDRLTAGYAGAVPAADVRALLSAVSVRLRDEPWASDDLLNTTEAVSRRALTDFLTRGTPLPLQ